jgi:F-type H+-transporting ATPase subunit epsilon
MPKGVKGKDDMRIRVIVPNGMVLEREASKITAPGTEGFFQVLPRHVSSSWSLRQGVLSVLGDDGEEHMAVDEGFLVKQDDLVIVTCLRAMPGGSLETLLEAVDRSFRETEEKEQQLKEVLVKLETETLKSFMDLG